MHRAELIKYYIIVWSLELARLVRNNFLIRNKYNVPLGLHNKNMRYYIKIIKIYFSFISIFPIQLLENIILENHMLNKTISIMTSLLHQRRLTKIKMQMINWYKTYQVAETLTLLIKNIRKKKKSTLIQTFIIFLT